MVNEELDLSEPDAFGQQLACDHLIVFKSSRGKEHAVLIVQDRFSKVLQAYPTMSREVSQLTSNLKHFAGLKSNSYTIVRSDAAGEILKAVIENNWLPESSVPARFPHILEREMRTFRRLPGHCFCKQVLLPDPSSGLKPAPTLQRPCLHLASSLLLRCNGHVCILKRK